MVRVEHKIDNGIKPRQEDQVGFNNQSADEESKNNSALSTSQDHNTICHECQSQPATPQPEHATLRFIGAELLQIPANSARTQFYDEVLPPQLHAVVKHSGPERKLSSFPGFPVYFTGLG